jgi:Zn-dependent peptidase ImmA (M78 family)
VPVERRQKNDGGQGSETLKIHVGTEKLTFLNYSGNQLIGGKMGINATAEAAYEVLRHHWNGQLPVDPVAIATKLGLSVYARGGPADPDYRISGELRSYSGQVFMAYNEAEPAVRQRLVAAQLLGHYALQHATPVCLQGDFFASSEPQLQAATEFARELLMPRTLVRDRLSASASSVEHLAQMFGVSKDAMGYRLLNIGLV